MTPSSHNMDVPNISRVEYTLLDVNEEGFVSLMAENGDTREDLSLPKGTDDADKLAEQIKAQFAEGQELVVSVLKAMGEEMINSVKVIQQ
jgi:translation initiation factor 5A